MESNDKKTLLCFGCQRRITQEDLRSGQHDHVDAEERTDKEYDLAVNNGGD